MDRRSRWAAKCATSASRQAARLVPDEDWESVRLEGLPHARSREELGYQRIFADHLGGIRAEQVLGRFAHA